MYIIVIIHFLSENDSMNNKISFNYYKFKKNILSCY